MAKNLLKAWKVDNTITTDDNTDKIFQLETARSTDLQLILDRMVAKNPGVLRGTMQLSVDLYNEVVAEAVMNGESVNTGLFRAVAQATSTEPTLAEATVPVPLRTEHAWPAGWVLTVTA